MYIQRSFDRE